jgi:hypothetical protein
VDVCEAKMKYDRVVALISHVSAEIYGFKYIHTLGIGTLKNMESIVFFPACSLYSQTLYQL